MTNHKFDDEIVLKIVGVKTYIYTYIVAVLWAFICLFLYILQEKGYTQVIEIGGYVAMYLIITLTAALVNHIAMSGYDRDFERVKHALRTGIYRTPLGGCIVFRNVVDIEGRTHYDGKHSVLFAGGYTYSYMYCYNLISTYKKWCDLKKNNSYTI